MVTFSWKLIKIIEYSPGYDFASFYTATRLIQSGNYEEIYSVDKENFNEVASPIFQDVAKREGFAYIPTPFFYPPIYVLPFLSLTSFQFEIARRICVVISLLFVLFALPLLYQMVKSSIEPFLKVSLILTGTFLSYPLYYSLHLGQSTPMIFFFLCLIYYLTSRNSDKSSGIFLGIITFMKISPFLLIIYFLARKRMKIVFSSILTILVLGTISLLIYGIPLHLSYFNTMREISGFDLVAWNNQSISAFLLRFLTSEDVLKWHPITLAFPLNLFKYTIIFGLLIIFLQQLKLYPPQFPLEYSAVITLILLLPPISWDHYFLFLLIPLVLIVDHLLERREQGYRGMIALACSAYLLTIVEVDFYSFFSTFPQNWFGKIVVSRISLGAFILGALTMVLLRREKSFMFLLVNLL